MAREKITQERIRKCSCPHDKKQFFLWDTGVTGLGVRVTATSKVYIFQDKLDGKSVRIKIGDTSTWPVDSTNPDHPGARQEAARLKTLIDKGIDPRLERREREERRAAEQAETLRKEFTVGEAWIAYIEERKPKWSNRHFKDHVNLSHAGGQKKKRGAGKTVPAVLSSLMPMKLSDLTPDFVQSWAEKESKTRPGQTRLAFALLSAFANWCEGSRNYNGLSHPKAFSRKIKKDSIPKQQPKNDSLQREQLPAWFSSVKKIPNQVISAYLQVLLITGARREELINLKWEQVEFTWRSLTIGDKVEGERTIPLTPYVAYLLRRLPKRNEWVFSSTRAKSGRLQEPRKAHNHALNDAGIEHLTIHGLRRSFANLTEWIEVPVGIVYQIQGHKPSATAEKHYRQRPLDLLRRWHVKIEEWIIKQAGVGTKHLDDATQTLRLLKNGFA